MPRLYRLRTLRKKHGQLPREKLAAHSITALADHELLAIILGTGYKKEDVLTLSHRVLTSYGDKAILKIRTVQDVMDVTGLPQVKASQLLAALELGRRFFHPDFSDFPTIRSPDDAYQIFQPMEQYKKETIEAIYLNAAQKVIHRETIGIGAPDHITLHPASIFEPAVGCRALGVIIAHNHPSGDTKPSKADRAETKALCKAGDLLGIPLLDHLIIGKGGYTSMLHG